MQLFCYINYLITCIWPPELWHEWDKRHYKLSRFELSDDDYLKLLRNLAEFCIMNDDFVVYMVEK